MFDSNLVQNVFFYQTGVSTRHPGLPWKRYMRGCEETEHEFKSYKHEEMNSPQA
jgi:hypothetical protein